VPVGDRRIVVSSTLGRFVSADTVVQDPFLSQAYDRYAYVFDNPLRYVDPTGHLTDEELARLFGFKDVESMFAAEWVKALQKSEVWQALKDAKNGDILAFRVGEQSYHWMFVASEEGGVGFWDMESRQLVAGDTDFFGAAFGMMDSWGLLRDEDRHGQKWEQVRASAGSSWEDYTPRPGWWEGETSHVFTSPRLKEDVSPASVILDLVMIFAGLASGPSGWGTVAAVAGGAKLGLEAFDYSFVHHPYPYSLWRPSYWP